ncbi:hypothetical protein GGQ76_004013 [Aureimonas jatrophae]|uniref:Helix-turn-helix domain-containing protein n=1 Tax=Aureimonas jatrophae TaxID=1166073 RepID=A0A1H0LR62_9HYPH|nr:hypothetical protein [Aureimonas jatrophae]SDO70486.1 hypothetical protein SAMN05192530_1112 [Aureimonas jatrophae]
MRTTVTTKYDWLEAVACEPSLARHPRVIRLAILLCGRFNPNEGLAWPSRLSLARWLGSNVTTVSRAITHLRRVGALTVVRGRDVSPAQRKGKDRRSNFYILNEAWAAAVLVRRQNLNGGEREEPAQLRKGRSKQRLTRKVPGTATLSDDCDGNHYTIGSNLIENAPDLSNGGRYACAKRLTSEIPLTPSFTMLSDANPKKPRRRSGPFDPLPRRPRLE